MTDQAYISPDRLRRGVAVHLVRHLGDDRARQLVPTGEWVELDPNIANDIAPTLRIDDAMARALLDALAAHFGGTSEVQTLRKDYLAERARVDKMIDALIVSRA